MKISLLSFETKRLYRKHDVSKLLACFNVHFQIFKYRIYQFIWSQIIKESKCKQLHTNFMYLMHLNSRSLQMRNLPKCFIYSASIDGIFRHYVQNFRVRATRSCTNLLFSFGAFYYVARRLLSRIWMRRIGRRFLRTRFWTREMKQKRDDRTKGNKRKENEIAAEVTVAGTNSGKSAM